MIAHAFYNKENVGDVLLIKVLNKDTFSYEKDGDLVTLYSSNQEVVGYNIFNASSLLTDLEEGMNDLSQEDYDFLNQKFNLSLEKSPCKIVVGKVLEMEEHPDSDHLHVCKVDVGNEQLQIVCGAPNVDVNQLVVVSMIGAVLPDGKFIEPSELRGVKSDGMLCAARELYLPNAPQRRGILVLSEPFNVGDDFFKVYKKGGQDLCLY